MPFRRTGFQINLFLLLEAYCCRLWIFCFIDARVGDSRRLLSEVFEREADYFLLTTPSEKNFSLIASRKEKNTWNIVKITFSCGNYNIFTFFSCCLPETRTKDHIRGPRTIENGRLFSNSKQNIYVWNLKLQDYREEHKSYLQEVFQLVTWRFGYDIQVNEFYARTKDHILYWCTKKSCGDLLGLNSFFKCKISYVPRNMHSCWPCKKKR